MIDYANKVAEVFRNSREDAGLSQAEVAKRMNVNKRSIQNWESGAFSPNIATSIEWFKAIDRPMYPYIMKLAHPEMHDLCVASSDEECKEALLTYVQELNPDECRKILFAFFGDHGSAPKGLVEMITAYLHIPLYARLSIASSIVVNYHVCEKKNLLTTPEHIMPNIQFLDACLDKTFEAVIKGKNTYT